MDLGLNAYARLRENIRNPQLFVIYPVNSPIILEISRSEPTRRRPQDGDHDHIGDNQADLLIASLAIERRLSRLAQDIAEVRSSFVRQNPDACRTFRFRPSNYVSVDLAEAAGTNLNLSEVGIGITNSNRPTILYR
jgi:hypothetical protein